MKEYQHPQQQKAVTWAGVLGGKRPDVLRLATYRLDEAELFNLAAWMNLGAEHRRVLVRFDRSGFRGYGPQRIVSPRWLQPVAPPVARASSGARPPVFHAKIGLVRRGDRIHIGVGSANLVSAAGRPTANLVWSVPASASRGSVGPAWVRRIERWIESRRPARTLVVRVRQHREPDTILTGGSSWRVFRDACGPDLSGDWVLSAPFVSSMPFRRLASEGRDARMSVAAFFPDGETARQVLSRLGSSSVRQSLKAFAPSTRDGFHQKIVAWRGVRSGSMRVLLYLGSANMTGAGFWGLHQRAIAWNWEAGVLLEGEASLWKLACRLARSGVRRWKRIQVPSRRTIGPEPDEFGGDDDDLDAALRQDLASRVTAKRRAITLHSRTGKGWHGWTFRDAWAIIDGRQWALGRPVGLDRAPSSIVVQGKYERLDQASRRQVRLVDLDFPELCAGPPSSVAYPALDALRAMLTGNSETAASAGSQHSSLEDIQPTADARVRTDVRFPFGDLVGAIASGADRVAPWLAHVRDHPRVPGFWKHLARQLADRLSSEKRQ